MNDTSDQSDQFFVGDRVYEAGHPEYHGTIQSIDEAPYGRFYIVCWDDGEITVTHRGYQISKLRKD